MQFRPVQLLGLALCVPSYVLAADCVVNAPGNNLFQTVDAMGILSGFQNNNVLGLSDNFELQAQHTETIEQGSTKGTIENDFLFENTHIAFSDVAFAMSDIISQCCSGATCLGGVFQIHGDTGLAVDVRLLPV